MNDDAVPDPVRSRDDRVLRLALIWNGQVVDEGMIYRALPNFQDWFYTDVFFYHASTIGALGGGSGTLDLGLGSLAAADDIDLSGINDEIDAHSGFANLIEWNGVSGA